MYTFLLIVLILFMLLMNVIMDSLNCFTILFLDILMVCLLVYQVDLLVN